MKPESLVDLAVDLMEQNRFSEAEPVLLRAIQAAREQRGGERTDVARLLHNLAVLCEASGRREEANSWWKEARALLDEEAD